MLHCYVNGFDIYVKRHAFEPRLFELSPNEPEYLHHPPLFIGNGGQADTTGRLFPLLAVDSLASFARWFCFKPLNVFN